MSPKKFDGMSPAANNIYVEQGKGLTRFELGVTDKQIIIPSFETTSKLFS